MAFFIKEDNIRPGNRGGKDQFKWDNVRLLNNKDREGYLGVTQSIGFLDKGGKWRKRDWWQNYAPESSDKLQNLKNEKESIRKEEERLLMETLNPGLKEKNSKLPLQVANNQKAKLTDFEWKELIKKEANFKPEDSALYEFYEDEAHKAGLGMKSSISFRTNPYEKSTEKNLTKLEGMGVKNQSEKGEEEEQDDNPYLNRNLVQNSNSTNPNSNTSISKYIKEYMREKKEREEQNIKILNTNKEKMISFSVMIDFDEKKKNKKRSRSRSRSRDRSKEKKKHKHSHKSSHKDRK
jgi:hypothetical protein